MEFVGKPKILIYQADHTIDLIFSNILFAKTAIRYDFDNESDYYIYIIIISNWKKKCDSYIEYRVKNN